MTSAWGTHQGWLIEAGASALLGAACAFAAGSLLLAEGAGGQLAGIAAIVSAGLSGSIAFAVLRRTAPAVEIPGPAFELEPIPEPELRCDAAQELLLTDALVTRPSAIVSETSPSEELLLDDVLAELRPTARVVQLFDVSSIPTPGQLQARIERHLSSSETKTPAPDASDELHQALAELRRSLR